MFISRSEYLSVILCLSVLLKVRRSSSIYRSFSALAALIRFSYSLPLLSPFMDVYPSFAADGCIFHLETHARSLADTCAEKDYLLALGDIGRAAFLALVIPAQRYNDTVMRAELLDAISLQQYVPSPPTQSYLLLFLQSTQRPLYCLPWQSVHRIRKSICFSLVVPSLSSLLHR